MDSVTYFDVIYLNDLCKSRLDRGLKKIRDLFKNEKDDTKYDLHEAFNIACCNGNLEIVKLLIEKNKKSEKYIEFDLSKGLISTCRNPDIKVINMKLVEFLIERGANIQDVTFRHICKSNNFLLVKLFLTPDFINYVTFTHGWSYIFCSACLSSTKEIIQLLASIIPKNEIEPWRLESCLSVYLLKINGDMAIVAELLKIGAPNIEKYLSYNCNRDNINILYYTFDVPFEILENIGGIEKLKNADIRRRSEKLRNVLNNFIINDLLNIVDEYGE